MASVGRGRGRGRGALKAEPETKPGGPAGDKPAAPVPVDEADEIASLIGNLSINQEDLKPVTEAVAKYSTTEDRQVEAMRLLYKRCQENWRMSFTASMLGSELVQLNPVGPVFRTALLQVMQADFSNKDSLRQTDLQRYLGCVSFICQTFGNIRLPDNEPFKPLLVPVFDCIETLLDNKATDEEMLCATVQIYTVGKLLKQYEAFRWRSVFNMVRDKILDSKGSRELRKKMIDLIEYIASEWRLPIPKDIHTLS